MPSMPDIGLLCWDYASPRGGMGRALRAMAGALREEAAVTVLAPGVLSEEGRSILPSTLRAGGHLAMSLLLPFARLPRVGASLVPSGPGGLLLVRRPPCARLVVVAYHTYAQQAACVPGERWKRALVPWERRTYRMADRVLCFSEDTRQCLIEEYDVEPGRIRLLPQAVTIPPLPPVARDSRLCLCVARLDRRKGVDVLLRAWPAVLRRVPDARLVVVGRGPLALPPDLAGSVAVRVRAAHPVTAGVGDFAVHDEVYADLALCPGNDVLRRLVAHGETGLLVPPGSAAALASAIGDLLSDAAPRARLGAAAAADIRRRCDPAAAGEALRRAVIDAEPRTT